MTESKERLDALKEILRDLLVPGQMIDDQAILGRFRDVYCDAEEHQIYRHEYGEISRFLLSEERFKAEGNDLIYTDLKRIAGLCEESNDLRKILLKLADHINLEVVHYEQYGEIEKAKAAVDTVKRQQELIEENVRKAQDKLDKIKRSMTKHNVQIVTVLGLFTGIVFAFSGGLTMLGSFFQSLGDINRHKALYLTGSLAMVGAVLYKVIQMLLLYSCALSSDEKDQGSKPKWWLENAIVIILLLVMLTAYGFYFAAPKWMIGAPESIQNNLVVSTKESKPTLLTESSSPSLTPSPTQSTKDQAVEVKTQGPSIETTGS